MNHNITFQNFIKSLNNQSFRTLIMGIVNVIATGISTVWLLLSSSPLLLSCLTCRCYHYSDCNYPCLLWISPPLYLNLALNNKTWKEVLKLLWCLPIELHTTCICFSPPGPGSLAKTLIKAWWLTVDAGHGKLKVSELTLFYASPPRKHPTGGASTPRSSPGAPKNYLRATKSAALGFKENYYTN